MYTMKESAMLTLQIICSRSTIFISGFAVINGGFLCYFVEYTLKLLMLMYATKVNLEFKNTSKNTPICNQGRHVFLPVSIHKLTAITITHQGKYLTTHQCLLLNQVMTPNKKS